MKTKFINSFQQGEQLTGTVLAVKQINTRTASNGTNYKDLVLFDKTGEISAKIWNGNLHSCPEIKSGDIIALNAIVEDFKGRLQLNIEKIELLDPTQVSLSNFVKAYDGDLNLLFSKFDRHIKLIKNPFLKKLAGHFLSNKKFKEKFKSAPGAQYLHHGYMGGLMQHLVEMLEISEKVCEIFPLINRELLIIGVLLHDIGKMDELETTATITRTRTGKLVPHLSYSANIAFEAINQIEKFPDELRDQVLHMILAHHGKIELGSPVRPMTLEAMALHLIDDISSKLTIMVEKINNHNQGGGTFTERIHALESEIYIPENYEENNSSQTEATLF